MRKLFKRILFTLIVLVAVVLAGAACLYHSELKTLLSLKQMNSHPFYTMTYDGDKIRDRTVVPWQIYR